MTKEFRSGLSVLIALAVGVWIILPPDRLMITDDCQPKGLLGSIKAAVHGRTFWSEELYFLDKSISDLSALPGRLAAGQRQADSLYASIDARTDSALQDLYVRYPALRPSSLSEAARDLRRQADELDAANLVALANDAAAARIRVLVACRPRVEARARGQD